MKRTLCFLLPSLAVFLFMSCVPSSKKIVYLEEKEKPVITILMGMSTTDAGIVELINDKAADLGDVELEWKTYDWGTSFPSALESCLASGQLPDIIIGKAQDVLTLYQEGILDCIDEDVTSLVKDNINDSVTFDGKTYGAVYNVMYQGVLYNKNIFYRYDLNPPSSLDELKEICTGLTEKGITPFSSYLGTSWYKANVMMQFAINSVYLHGDSWKAVERSFETLVRNTLGTSLYFDESQAVSEFVGESSAMITTGSWTIQEIKSCAPYMNIGIFPFPNEEGDARLIYEPNLTFMKTSHGKNKEKVDEIIRLIFEDKELSADVYSFTQTGSALKDVDVDSPVMIKDDIDLYERNDMMIDSSTGNSHMKWEDQLDKSEEITRKFM